MSEEQALDLDINAPLASQEASVGPLEANNMQPLIETLAEEMRLTTRNESHAIVCSSDGVWVLRRKELQIPDVPVLIIDADADPALLELYFGRKVDLVDIPVERLAEIHQFKDRTFSKTSLLKADDGALLKDVESFVERVSPSGATLVVASKGVRKALSGEVDLELPADIPFAGATLTHFNSLRGVNRYSDYQNIVIVGREQPCHYRAGAAGPRPVVGLRKSLLSFWRTSRVAGPLSRRRAPTGFRTARNQQRHTRIPISALARCSGRLGRQSRCKLSIA